MAGKPEPPPEAALIKRVREARRLSIPEVSARAGISASRWSQIENGYERKAGTSVAVRAPSGTLAHMANVLGIRPEQLTLVGRSDAIDVLEEITRSAEPAPVAEGVGEAVGALQREAQARDQTVAELLLKYGIDARELVLPDSAPYDPEIAELEEMGARLGFSRKVIDQMIIMNLENRARRYREAHERRAAEENGRRAQAAD